MSIFLSIRIGGMCAFASNNDDPNQATNFFAVMPDVGAVIPGDRHVPALSFKAENYLSGGALASATHIPGGTDPMGVWPFMFCELTMMGIASSALKPQALNLIASLKEVFSLPDEQIHPECIYNPSLQKVAAVIPISAGSLYCTPEELGHGNPPSDQFAREVHLKLDLVSDTVKINAFNFKDPMKSDSLELQSRQGQPIEIAITNFSIPSFSPSAPDHAKVYLELRKNKDAFHARTFDCQPMKMVQ